MPDLEKILEVVGGRNLKVTVESDESELIEIISRDKNIDVVIKDNEGFKKLIKELRK